MKAQIETIQEYVRECSKRHFGGNREIRFYAGDNGVSGSLDPERRDGLRTLLAEITRVLDSEDLSRESEKIKGGIHVVAYDATRLARSVSVGTLLKERFEKMGVTLHLAQPRMLVEGANADLFFGLNLQLAANERVATIKRVKNSFEHRPDWDPRKSYGWKFEGAGKPPVKLSEEQATLEKIEKMFVVDGLRVCEISKTVQQETGGRRVRRLGAEDHEMVPWTSTEISFLCKLHKWVWGGGNTFVDLEKITDSEKDADETLTMEDFLERHRGEIFNGVKINRAMLKRYFPDSRPPWITKAIERLRVWIRSEKYSVDDLVDLLNDQVPRGDSAKSKTWPRQTAWRLVRETESLEKKERMAKLLAN